MNQLLQNPILGVVLTLIAYHFSQKIYRKWRFLHPILTSSALILLVISIFQIPISSYQNGGKILNYLLGPATIALGVPIYKQRALIAKQIRTILSAVTLGSLIGIFSAAGLNILCGTPYNLTLSMLPKSVSSPIAVEISQTIGGMPEISALFTVLTGLIGGICGTIFLKKTGIRHPIALGLAMGTASHGFGTARSLQDSELQGTLSGLAMGLAGIITSLLFIPIKLWLL